MRVIKKSVLSILFAVLLSCFTLGLGACYFNCYGVKIETGAKLFYQLVDDSYYFVTGVRDLTEEPLTVPAEYEGKPVTGIAKNAFRYNAKLNGIVLPGSIVTIGDNAFEDCKNLAGISLTNVISVGDMAFYGCTNLADVTFGGSLVYIGKLAFSGCVNMSGEITLPDSVKYLGEGAFSQCDSITGLTIGSGVDDIRDSAFFGCDKLASVTIGDNVKGIGYSAFAYCVELTAITIPNSVTNVGNYAFDNCSKLTDITFKGTKEQWAEIVKNSNVYHSDWDNGLGEYTVHCTDGDLVIIELT